MSIDAGSSNARAASKRGYDWAHLLVPPAISIVAAAMGVAAYLHLGLTIELASAVGLALFCLMLLCHVLLRAAEAADRANEEAAGRRMAQVASPIQPAEPVQRAGRAAAIAPVAAAEAATPAPAAQGPDKPQVDDKQPVELSGTGTSAPVVATPAIASSADTDHTSIASAATSTSTKAKPAAVPLPPVLERNVLEPAVPEAAVLAPPAFGRREPGGALSAGPGKLPAGAAGAGGVLVAGELKVPGMDLEKPDRTIQLAGEIASARQAMRADAAGTAQPLPAAWAYRPVDVQLPAPEGRDAAGKAQLDAGRPPPPLGALRPTLAEDFEAAGAQQRPRTEADRIDMILKRLATQIRTGAASNAPAQAASSTQPLSDAGSAAALSTPTSAEPAPASPGADELTVPADTALASAVDALRSTVDAMRAGSGHGGAGSTGHGQAGAQQTMPSPAYSTPIVTPAEVRLAAVAEALAAERADVFLEPILGLADDQARHFEVSVRLRSAAGEVLDARSQCAGGGGAGLLPLLDAMGVRHAAGFALKLERRGREGAVFSQIAGQSLESDQFVSDVAGRHAQGIADRLVLTFEQHEMRGLGPAQLSALGDLGRLGFRFALQGVSELDMDFEALQALGFEFVKLDAEVFLQGLHCGATEVPASDLCRHFAELGLAVIVSGIHHQDLNQRVRGCGVTFGQGQLFGGARPVPVAGNTNAGMAA